MSLKKTILIVGLVGLAGYMYLEYKVRKAIELFQFMKISPTAIKNLIIKWNDAQPFVTFNLDLKIENPTTEVFDANFTSVTIKEIFFYDKKNNRIGSSKINLKAITIPANSFLIIPSVPIKLDLQTAIISATEVIIKGGFEATDMRVECIVSILGTDYKI